MSSTPVRDALKRSLQQVYGKLDGLVGDRVVTIYLDDVVSLTVSLDVAHLRSDVYSTLTDIFLAENAEIEGKYFRGGKAVQS